MGNLDYYRKLSKIRPPPSVSDSSVSKGIINFSLSRFFAAGIFLSNSISLDQIRQHISFLGVSPSLLLRNLPYIKINSDMV